MKKMCFFFNETGQIDFLERKMLYREGLKNWKMPRRRPEFEPGEAGS